MSASADRTFYYQAADGTQRGPVSFEQLRMLIGEGRVTCITKIRKLHEQIWRAALDLQELQQLFFTQAPGKKRIEDKRISELTVGDVPAAWLSIAAAYAKWAFFLWYIPNCFFMLMTGIGLLVMDHHLQMSITGTSLFGGFIFAFSVPALDCLWMVIAPLVVWGAFIRDRISFPVFVLAEMVTSFLGGLAIYLWAIYLEVSVFDGLRALLLKIGMP